MTSIRHIATKYEGFILDQYGVLHNGTSAYPGVLECLEALHQQQKQLIILSNTSERAQAMLDRLHAYGIDKELFMGAITSGEQAYKYIDRHRRGQTCVRFAKANATMEYLTSLDLTLASIEEADFILAQNPSEIHQGLNNVVSTKFVESGDLAIFQPLLERGVARGIPMLCCNPDLISIKQDGEINHMPGKLAQCYEQLGGQVQYFGKPHIEHFQACIESLALPHENIVHVGDSLPHDITGANACHLDSIFVASGIHAPFLNIPTDDAREATLNLEHLEQLYATFACRPTHVVPSFYW